MTIFFVYLVFTFLHASVWAEDQKTFNVRHVSWIANPPYYIQGHQRVGMVPQTLKYHLDDVVANIKGVKFTFIDEHKYHLQTENELLDLIAETNKTRLLERLNTTNDSPDIFIASATTKKQTRGFFTPMPIIERETIVVIRRTADLLLIIQFFQGISACCGVILLAVTLALNLAALIWIIERRNNPSFHNNFGAGLWASFWYCFVTMTTVGYGDKIPKSFLSRLLCLFWMIFGVMLTAIITTTVMEAVQGESSKIDKKVAISDSNIEASFVQNKLSGIPMVYKTYKEIMNAVRNKEVYAGILDTYTAAYVFKEGNVRDLRMESEKTMHKTVWVHVYQNGEVTNLTFSLTEYTVPKETSLRVETLFIPHYVVSHYYARKYYELFDHTDGGLIFYSTIVASTMAFLGIISHIVYTIWKKKMRQQKKPTVSRILDPASPEILLLLELQRTVNEKVDLLKGEISKRETDRGENGILNESYH